MLNEKRIRLMMKAAEFEQREGRRAFKVNEYYRVDYVSLHMVKAAISGSIGYAILLVLWAFYKMESLLAELHSMDMYAFGMGLLKWYLIFLIIYEIIIFFVYNTRYTRTRALMGGYYSQLGEISKLYEEEDKRLEGRENIGGRGDHD